MARKEIAPQETKDKAITQSRELMNPFLSFRHDMDKLMEGFLSGFDLRPFSSRPDTFIPHIDIVNTDKEIKVSAELPGMDDKDIEVTLTAEALTIKGEKKEEKEERGKDFYRSERSYGSFSRTVPLPVSIETENVTASFDKGVLVVKLPKSPQAIKGIKKIPVTAE